MHAHMFLALTGIFQRQYQTQFTPTGDGLEGGEGEGDGYRAVGEVTGALGAEAAAAPLQGRLEARASLEGCRGERLGPGGGGSKCPRGCARVRGQQR